MSAETADRVAEAAATIPGAQTKALAHRDPAQPSSLAVPLPPMTDAEVASSFRVARALAESGLFKDAKNAGQAFAKILAGRDLGLTPFEAMSSLHVIDGKIEASADLHATRVRTRPGFDYRVLWIKADGDGGDPTAGGREAVWADEEDPTDLREYVGCAIVFSEGGKQRGVSRWTVEDSARADLLSPRGQSAKTSPHVSYPRSMFFARAMSQGVGFYVPEVMGGIRVYTPGELGGAEGEDLTAGDPREWSQRPEANLPTSVAALVARARELGHAGLGNAEAAAMATAGQPQATVDAWCERATAELNRMSSGKPAAAAEPEPPDVDVVTCGVEDPSCPAVTCALDADHEGDEHRGANGQTWSVDANTGPLPSDGAPAPETEGEPQDAPQAPQDDARGPESADVPDDDLERAAAVAEGARQAMAERLELVERQAEDARADGRDGEADDLGLEASSIREQLAGLDPGQGSLPL